MKPTETIKIDPATEIVAAIKSIPARLAPGAAKDPGWTALLKSEIRRIGEDDGYLVCPDDSDGQWLYDLVWYRNDSNNQLREVALVFESEWSRDPSYIKFDFEKLLVAKASLKVMIFQDDGRNLRELWRLLKDGIRIFEKQSPDETYILAAFKEEQHEFEVHVVSHAM